MSPMILSDKVAGIIKDLEVKVGIQEIALQSAMRRIDELNDQMYDLIKENEALEKELRAK